MIPSSASKGVIVSQVLAPWDTERTIFFDRKRLLANTKGTKIITVYDLFKVRRKVTKIYCRDIYNFIFFQLFLKFFLKADVIYDFRGILHEESFLKNDSRLRRAILRAIEKFCYKKADEVRTVSQNLAEYLKHEFGERPINVIPCCISEAEIMSSPIKKNQSEVSRFVYVGSVSRWQCFEDAIKMYADLEIEKTLNVLTPDLQKAKEIISKYSIECNVENASRDQVLRILRTSDFGFVLRERSIVNCTASPIKFLEYVSQGVVPICTPFVGDYSESFKDLAYIVPETNACLSKEKVESLNRLDVKNKLIDRSKGYTWENYFGMFL